MKGDRMDYEETVATLEDKLDEHHEIMHRLVTLIDTLQDRVMRLEARVESIYSPEAYEQPWHTH
ncbi:hypothetical protein BH24ACI4_BH24ACI4_13690 [soil metagenome]